MQKKNKNKTSKKVFAALAAPMALGSMILPGLDGGVADAATGVPGKITNPTIDWDTFSHEAISLVWDANPDATGYIVERNGEEVYRGTQPRFDDTGLASGATYQYAIYAYNENGLGIPNIDYIQTDFVYQSITLNWLPVEDAVEFLIERDGEVIASTDADTFTYTDDTALVGNKYRYKVIPVDGEGEPFGEPFDFGDLIPNYEEPTITDPPNRAPTSTAISKIELEVEQTKTLTLDSYFSDPNGDILTYSVTAADGSVIEVKTTGNRGQTLDLKGLTEGDTNILITAEDGRGGTVQRKVAVTVKDPVLVNPPTDGGDTDPKPLDNVAPETRYMPGKTIEVGEVDSINLNNYFNDADGDELHYTVHVNNERVSATEDGSTLTLEGLEQGVATVTVYANDGFGHTVQQSFDVKVVLPQDGTDADGPEIPDEQEDRPPVAVGSIGNMVMDLGQSRTVYLDSHLVDPDGDALEYTVETNVEGIISTTQYKTGQHPVLKVTGTKVGQTAVKVTATDAFGNKATQTFVAKVEEPFIVTPEEPEEEEVVDNHAPVSKDIKDGKITINTTKKIPLNYYFSDEDGDEITYEVRGTNSNVARTLDENGMLQIEGKKLGKTTITVYATDSHGATTTDTFEIEVVPAAIQPPYYQIQDILYGPDFVEIEWYPIYGAAGYWIYLNDDLMFTQEEDGSVFYHYRAEGLDPSIDNELIVQAYGEDGEPIGDPFSFPIEPIDALPDFDVHSKVEENDVTVSWDMKDIDATAYNVVIKDADGNVVDAKEYTYAGATQHTVRIDKAGIYTASVAPKVNGEYIHAKAVNFVVDADFVANNKPSEVKDALGNSIKVTIGEEPFTKDLDNVFEDVDGDALSYKVRLNNTNASAVIEGSVLKVQGNTPGTTTATITVTDEHGDSITKNVLVYVEKAPNKAPVVETQIPDQEMKISDDELVLETAEFFKDPEGGNVTVSVGTLTNKNVSVSSDGSKVTITPNKVGVTQVQLIGTDAEGAKVTATFNVTVNEVAPEAVTNLYAVATSYDEVTLSFDKVGNAKEYVIVRDGEEIARTASATYVDKNLTAETAYEYEVVAVNDIGQSEPAKASAETLAMPQVENLKADVEEQTVVLSWDAFAGSEKYKVYRYIQQADGSFKLDNYGQTVTGTSFTDAKLKGEAVYEYKVVPFVQSKNKFVDEFGATVQAETEEVNLAPVVSTAIPAQELLTTDSAKTLNLTDFFSDPNGDELKFEIVDVSKSHVEAAVNGANLSLTPVREGSADVTIKVTDPKGLSVESTITVKVVEPKPEAVTDLALAAQSASSVKVDFKASEKAKEYIIKRDGAEITRVTEPTFVDTGLKAKTEYQYEVIAVNESGQSEAVLGKVTTDALPIVQNIKAVETGEGAVTITWDKYDGANRYLVTTFKKVNGEFEQQGYGKAISTNKLDLKNLETDADYYFAVTPFVNNKQENDLLGNSNEIHLAKPVPVAPSTLEFDVALNGKTANLSVKEFIDQGVTASNYRVYVDVKNADGSYTRTGTKVLTASELNASFELEAGKEYKFEVTPRIGFKYESEHAETKIVTVAADETPSEPVDEEIKPEEVQIKGVTAVANGSEVTVSWNTVGTSTTYKVYRYEVLADGTYKLDGPAVRVDNVNTFVDKNAKPNKDYLYVVAPLDGNRYNAAKAMGGTVTTGDKIVVGQDTSASAIKNIQVNIVGKNAVVTWDALEGTSKYKLTTYVQQADGSWKSSSNLTASSNTQTFKNVVAGKNYKFEVTPVVGGKYDSAYASSIEFQN